MKTLLIALLTVLYSLVAGPSPGRARPESTYALVDLISQAIDSTDAQDSVEASTPVLVPFQRDIERVSREVQLPPALSAAIIQIESKFGQWSTRTEPPYKKKSVVQRQAIVWSRQHGGIPTTATEIDDRSRSYGLTQIMGQTAREEGFAYRYLAKLYLSEDNIRAGLTHFKLLLDRYRGDTLSAISAYNQGNNRKAKSGHFKNAGYVYRVALAWAAYDRAFKHSTLIHENRLRKDSPGAPAGSPVLDRAEALRTDTASSAIGAGSISSGSGHNDRHNPPRSGPGDGAGNEPLGGHDHTRGNEGVFYVILAATTLSAVGLLAGYGFFSGRSGHDRDPVRPSERLLLAKSETRTTRPASTAYTRRLRLRDRAKRIAQLGRRRSDRA
jgi:hypothetical protein